MAVKPIYLKAQNINLRFPESVSAGGKRNSFWQKVLGLGHSFSVPVENRPILNDINIDLKAGDRLGLKGHNGAGKTTLLKVLAGGLPPQTGTIESSGKTVCLLSRTQGMSLEASGFENIILRGIFLGFSVSQMQEMADEIIKFSGLKDHIHKPLRAYSAGMRARLSFSIIMASKPEILLLDEWLGAGDKDFREKAQTAMRDLLDQAAIIVFATHNERLMNAVCNKFVTMENGKIIDLK